MFGRGWVKDATRRSLSTRQPWSGAGPAAESERRRCRWCGCGCAKRREKEATAVCMYDGGLTVQRSRLWLSLLVQDVGIRGGGRRLAGKLWRRAGGGDGEDGEG